MSDPTSEPRLDEQARHIAWHISQRWLTVPYGPTLIADVASALALYRPAGETRAGTVRGTVYAWETGQMSLVADPSIPIGEVQVRDEHGNVLMRIVGFDTALPPSHAGEADNA